MNENSDIPATSEAVELLTFHIGDQDYAINIGSTREIRSWAEPSSLPDAPAFVLGVINLRGVVVPLLDLAARLGLALKERDQRNVIIVVEINDQPMGLLVDAVSDIIAPADDEIQPPPEAAKSSDHSYVRALTFVDKKIVRILDLQSVIPPIEAAA